MYSNAQDWGPGLSKKKKARWAPEFITRCFLTLDTTWLVTSASCCHALPALMDCTPCDPPSLKLLLLRCLVTKIATPFSLSFALSFQISESLAYLLHLCKTWSLGNLPDGWSVALGSYYSPVCLYCKVVTGFLIYHPLFMVGQTPRTVPSAHTFKFMSPSSWEIFQRTTTSVCCLMDFSLLWGWKEVTYTKGWTHELKRL